MLPIYSSNSTWRQPQQQAQQHSASSFGPRRLTLTQGEADGEEIIEMINNDSASSMAIADVPVGDRANQLAWRFARMLAHRHRARGLILIDGEEEAGRTTRTGPLSSSLIASVPERRAKRKQNFARSKNCATVRRYPTGGKLSRLARAHATADRHLQGNTEADEQEQRELETTIRELRDTIASLEQSQLLADSALATWRANRSGVAVETCRQYFLQFSRGYDPSNPALAARSATTREFMISAVEQDVVARDFQGVDAFLRQWQKYTMHYDNFSSRMVSITLVDDEDQYVSLRAAAEMRFSFNMDSLRSLYPYLYQQMQTSAEARAICEKLLGKECRLAFDIGMHFNQRGKVFVHESRVHLASALLDLISDPFAVMKVLNSSLITEDGHWKTPGSTDIQESPNALPKSLL